MKTTILEQLIHRILFEQTDSSVEDTVDINVNVDSATKFKVKAASQSALTSAESNGAVYTGWSAFIIKRVASKQNIDITSTNDAATVLKLAINNRFGEPQATSYYGESGQYNKLDSNGNPKYMYVVGPNIGLRKRVQKHNVWVCNFSQLYNISVQLEKEKLPSTYFEKIKDVFRDSAAKLGNIVILDYKDAVSWFNELARSIKGTKFEKMKPIDSAVLIPNLSSLSKDYEPESDTSSEKPKEITIDETTAERYNYPSFVGRAILTRDTYGNEIIIPVNGRIGVRQSTGKKLSGEFEGEFKNGAPYNGTITHYTEDGDVYSTYTGILKNVSVLVDKTGNRNFYYEIPYETINNQENSLTYPYTITSGETKGRIVYTLSNSDEWVYTKFNDKWYTVKKSEFENYINNGGDISSKVKELPSTNTAVYDKLNALIK